ncbi:MAG: aspartate aminotransferase family protein [Desulfosalsimonadaceae bacterium]
MKNEMIERADSVLAATYKRFPLVIERGQGSTLWDTDGRAYTDFVAGIAVCNLGHACPEVAKALSLQAEQLFHVSNLYYTLPQIELAAWLVDNSFADRVFFCNSGAEANEAAIKLARKNFYDKGQTDRYKIITMEKSFHGRTFATLSATGQQKIREGYAPVLSGFEFVPFNDIDALKRRMGNDICAVMLEPIQGEGGVICPDAPYLAAVRQLCDEAGALLIFDEVQTGMGRTGRMFAYEHFGIAPDIMTLAKALGNGLPIGAMLAKENVMAAFQPGAHASTFGGTPVITAAALTVVRIMERDQIPERCRKTGEYFKTRLLELKERHEIIEDVRGLGLLVGLKLKASGASIVAECMSRGFLINCTQENILRFIPPLIITHQEIDALIHCLDDIFSGMRI